MSHIEYTVKVFSNGSKSWWLNGKLHREDGPAIEEADGSKYWYLNGKIHREDGPAVEYANGYKTWHLNGKCHRADGPAVEYADGSKAWVLEGTKLTESEFLARTKPVKQLTVAEVESMLGFKVEIVS
jgi:hypothetical protein